MNPPERREAIVSAALTVMVRKGIAATTVREVAAEMGTSSGLIHHYFESMDHLLAAAFHRAGAADLQTTVAAMSEGDDPVDRLALFFASYSRADEDAAFQLWLDAWAEATRHPELQRTSRRLNGAWQGILADLIREGVAAQLMECDEADAAAWRILSLLDGLVLQAVAHGPSISREQVTAWSHLQAERELQLTPGELARRMRTAAAATAPATMAPAT
jgi:AcrR family transcriptional regulator